MALHTADSPRAIRPAVERHAARNRQSPRVAARNISGSVDGTRSDSGSGGTTRVYCQSRVQGSASRVRPRVQRSVLESSPRVRGLADELWTSQDSGRTVDSRTDSELWTPDSGLTVFLPTNAFQSRETRNRPIASFDARALHGRDERVDRG